MIPGLRESVGTQTPPTCQSCQRPGRMGEAPLDDQNWYKNFIPALEGISTGHSKPDPHLRWLGLVECHRAQRHQSHILEILEWDTEMCTHHSSPWPGTVQSKTRIWGNRTTYTWGLVHGTTVSAAAAILTEGLIRPADWQRNADPSKSQLPTFGLFSIGQQVSRNDTEISDWAEKDLLDRGNSPFWSVASTRAPNSMSCFELEEMMNLKSKSLWPNPAWLPRVRNMFFVTQLTSASASWWWHGMIYRRFLRQLMMTLGHRTIANSGISMMTKVRTFRSTAMSRSILKPVTGFLFLGFPGHAFIDKKRRCRTVVSIWW